MNKYIVNGFFLLVGVMLVLSHCSALKNVDLAWNSKHLDLEDCNGIVCQDVSVMYNASMMYLFVLEPILITIYIISLLTVILLCAKNDD